MRPVNENARPAGKLDRASKGFGFVRGAHYDSSLARSKENATRWLPNPESCAGQLLLELIERADRLDLDGITPRMFYRSAWSQRMAAYVCRLREGGWTIETSLHEASNRYDRVQHAAYVLILDVDPAGAVLADWMERAREVRP